MYNEHIVCKETEEILEIIELLANGEDTDMTKEEVCEWVQDLYDDGKMASTQYDKFMRELDEI